MKKDGDVKDNPAVNADKIVTFPLGIPGFEKYTTYVVYHKGERYCRIIAGFEPIGT